MVIKVLCVTKNDGDPLMKYIAFVCIAVVSVVNLNLETPMCDMMQCNSFKDQFCVEA